MRCLCLRGSVEYNIKTLQIHLVRAVCLSTSRPNMDFLPMLNAETSILSKLVTILDDLELSVSLDEKITLMEEFICTLSSCSNGSFAQETSVYSMWRESTQISSVAMEHRKRVTTMRQKMGMWSQEDWKGRAELAYLRLARRGLLSSWQRVETSFLLASRRWILEHFALISPLSEHTPTGNTEKTPNPTEHQKELASLWMDTQNLVTGYNTLWVEMRLQVSNPGFVTFNF
ncbi:putative C2 protein [Genomoviridae sp.]|nr:putative C2 protein [Genomoviridae sp.]